MQSVEVGGVVGAGGVEKAWTNWREGRTASWRVGDGRGSGGGGGWGSVSAPTSGQRQQGPVRLHDVRGGVVGHGPVEEATQVLRGACNLKGKEITN